MRTLYTILIITLISVWLIPSEIQASRIAYDQKYVTVGVFTNSDLPQLTNNPNIRFYKSNEIDDAISGDSKAINDLIKTLLDYSNGKPSLKRLYQQALSQTTREEIQIAEQDLSAETEAILKDEIAKQLLKNNYIVYIDEVPELDKNGKQKDSAWSGKPKFHYEWKVYHLGIDDEIINQIFYNWDNPSGFAQIICPITLVADGKLKEKRINQIILEISKKVSAFAIRGPIISNHPTLAKVSSLQGIKTGDRFRVYRMYEDKNGKHYSKRVSEARVLTTDYNDTKLKIIAGRYPNYKNGEVAAFYGRTKSSISLQGQYSMGNDPRTGGRLTYEWMPKYTSKGLSHYISVSLEYQQFKPDPHGVWFSGSDFNSESKRPKLNNFGVNVGYGIGFSLLTKIELTPYVMIGPMFYDISDYKGLGIWNSSEQKFEGIGNTPDTPTITAGWNVYGGVRLAFNIYYPLQLIVGAECNATWVPDEKYQIITKRHNLSRLNLFGGLRFNF